MKSIFIIIFLFFFGHFFGQKIYRAERDAYVSNKYTYKFYFYSDSSCYLKGHYFNNVTYFIYKGRLKKLNDSIYEFNFQPIVNFSCNKGYHIKDSVPIYLTQKDTLIPSLKYDVKAENHGWTSIQLNSEKTTVFIKGITDKSFLINTKFTDPITKQPVLMTTGYTSITDLTYYGCRTKFNSLKITFIKKGLIVYPDHDFVQDKDIFILEK